jgi:hypothetical protein
MDSPFPQCDGKYSKVRLSGTSFKQQTARKCDVLQRVVAGDRQTGIFLFDDADLIHRILQSHF